MAVGPLVVAVYASGRAPAWVFRVPTTEPLPARAGEFRLATDIEPPLAELNSFRLTGSWLIARLWGTTSDRPRPHVACCLGTRHE
ncbi:MAG: hypothetical protein U0792_09785 [Gemmataceae bacterium]